MINAKQAHGPASKAQEYLAGWQRARAELDNFRKKVKEQASISKQQQAAELVEPLLSLADNFRAMAQHVPAELKGNTWAEGVLHIARQLDSILADYNVTVIADQTTAFDPKIHEAVATEKSTQYTSGQIIEIVQAGYRVGERIIRPAKVKVAQ